MDVGNAKAMLEHRWPSMQSSPIKREGNQHYYLRDAHGCVNAASAGCARAAHLRFLFLDEAIQLRTIVIRRFFGNGDIVHM